jgi:BTB/POZ domain-containing protein
MAAISTDYKWKIYTQGSAASYSFIPAMKKQIKALQGGERCTYELKNLTANVSFLSDQNLTVYDLFWRFGIGVKQFNKAASPPTVVIKGYHDHPYMASGNGYLVACHHKHLTTFSDYTLQYKDQKFRIDRAVFAEKSSVFSRLCEEKARQSAAGETLSLAEALPDGCVKMFVDYLYNQIPDLKGCTLDQLKGLEQLAAEWKLSYLKYLCYNSLLQRVTPENLEEFVTYDWTCAKVQAYLVCYAFAKAASLEECKTVLDIAKNKNISRQKILAVVDKPIALLKIDEYNELQGFIELALEYNAESLLKVCNAQVETFLPQLLTSSPLQVVLEYYIMLFNVREKVDRDFQPEFYAQVPTALYMHIATKMYTGVTYEDWKSCLIASSRCLTLEKMVEPWFGKFFRTNLSEIEQVATDFKLEYVLKAIDAERQRRKISDT